MVDIRWRIVGRGMGEGRFLPGLQKEKIFELKFCKDLLTCVDFDDEEEDVVELIGRRGIYKKNRKFHRNYFQISLTMVGWVTVGGLLLVLVVLVVVLLVLLVLGRPNKQQVKQEAKQRWQDI